MFFLSKSVASFLFFSLFFGCSDQERKKDDSHSPAVATNVFDEESSTLSKNKHFSISIEWLKGPTVGFSKTNAALVTVANGERQLPSSVTDFTFLPYMTVHGHPGALKKMKVVKYEGLENVYHAYDWYFTMPGQWDLTVTAVVDGKADEAVITLPNVVKE